MFDSLWLVTSSPPNKSEDGDVPTARVGNFRQKNNSAEDGIDGTNGYIRRNSGCSAEQKILRIPFRTLPRKRKRLGIPFRGTKIEANYQNSFPNPSAEEKTTWNSVPWNKK